jgi:hypothetical protein
MHLVALALLLIVFSSTKMHCCRRSKQTMTNQSESWDAVIDVQSADLRRQSFTNKRLRYADCCQILKNRTSFTYLLHQHRRTPARQWYTQQVIGDMNLRFYFRIRRSA